MAWYNAGTITVTNGSTVVTGAGTDFVINVAPRDALLVDGGNPLEIASVQSATQLTLASPWLGGSAGGRPYKVQPTVGIYVDLALRALGMLDTFATVRDGIGQGLIPNGTLAAPGIRFSSDQDTGIRRVGENAISIVAGGVDRLFVGAFGATVKGGATCAQNDIVGVAAPTLGQTPPACAFFSDSGQSYGLLAGVHGTTGHTWLQAQRVDGNTAQYNLLLQPSGGNLLVGVTNGNVHTISKAGAQGTQQLNVFGAAAFFAGGGGTGSSAAAALIVTFNTTTGRSINAGGTINASGADYAEYMVKATGCGEIAKADVCGVDREGRLTRSWSEAVRYVVKSTDPNLVGGDTWSAHLPPRPETPGDAPIEPVPPAPTGASEIPAEPVREDGEEEIDFIRRMAGYLVAMSAMAATMTADRDAMLAYQAAAAAYPAAKAAHDAAQAAYEANLAAWEQALEEARWTVDRIAFSGQVPINVTEEALAICEGALEDGEAVYLVAVARGGGIGAQAVRESDMTLPLYMRRLGAVWAIRDGRPIIDVQHG